VNKTTGTFVKLDAQLVFNEGLLWEIVLMELGMYNISEG